eukprot:TRINITY_DN6416_c0_g2_i1.p1 TRINITY_DN6416_c0_g2~~TRINITY_DN6416_c0_g2_i1.p1  ORF type:complete len:417 (-),score=32.82 TRINITY_DN6416_c0_g2_i1:535-1785(-)
MKAEPSGLRFKWGNEADLVTLRDFGIRQVSLWYSSGSERDTSSSTPVVSSPNIVDEGSTWFERFVLEDSGELVGYSSPETGSVPLWNSSSGLLVFHRGKLPALAVSYMTMYYIIPSVPYRLIRHLPETTADDTLLHDMRREILGLSGQEQHHTSRPGTFISKEEPAKASPCDRIRELWEIALQKQSDFPALNLTTLGDGFYESLLDYLSTTNASELEDFVASCLLELRSEWYRMNDLVDPREPLLPWDDEIESLLPEGGLRAALLDVRAALLAGGWLDGMVGGSPGASYPSPSYRGKGWRWFSRQPDIMLHNHSNARISVRVEKFSEDKFELVRHFSKTQLTGCNKESGIPPQHFIRERVLRRYSSWCAMSGDWTSGQVVGGGVYFVKEVNQHGNAVLHLNKLVDDCTCTYCTVVD